MIFIDLVEVVTMHHAVIEKMGGRPGMHDEGLLDSAINQPLKVFEYGDKDEQEITYLAAVYFFHIIKNHPFIDGNKRTGLLTALKFLALNGYDLHRSDMLYDDLYQIAIDTAASRKSKKDIAIFFKKQLNTVGS